MSRYSNIIYTGLGYHDQLTRSRRCEHSLMQRLPKLLQLGQLSKTDVLPNGKTVAWHSAYVDLNCKF